MLGFTPDVSSHRSRFRGVVYRALNPLWAHAPLSGAGAARFGGRFNPRGLPALYTSLTPLTAIREANQAGAFQPVTLIAIELEASPILDTRDQTSLAPYGIEPDELVASDWRARMLAGRHVPTHEFAQTAIEAGLAGILVPSQAPGAHPSDINLVLWHWPDAIVIDDENHLGTQT